MGFKKLLSVFIVLMLGCIFSGRVGAEEFRLKNGDRITGTIVEETDDEVRIQTQAFGLVTLKREFIKPPEVKPDVVWERKFSGGYSQTGGNTKRSSGSTRLSIIRKAKDNEQTFKMDAFFGSTNKKEDTRKYYGLLRHAYSFGMEKKWYHFVKLEGDKDRFANINYRLIPSTGVGYWFFDEDDFKLMSELAVGFEHTNFRDSTKSTNEAVLVPRLFAEKKFWDNITLSQDVTIYEQFDDFEKYRLHSETALNFKINHRLSTKFSFIDDYNSSPSGSKKKNDYRLVSSLEYLF